MEGRAAIGGRITTILLGVLVGLVLEGSTQIRPLYALLAIALASVGKFA